MRAIDLGIRFFEALVFGLQQFQLVLEVLDVFFLALSESPLRRSVLGSATLYAGLASAPCMDSVQSLPHEKGDHAGCIEVL